MYKKLEDTVELIIFFVSVYIFPDTFALRREFESCQNITCVDFNEFNDPPMYRQFNFSLFDEGKLDSRLMVDETMGEVEIVKGTHVI